MKETIELDLPYRVEFNWNAIADFVESEGLKLSNLEDMRDLTVSQITRLIYCGVKEGERLDGHDFGMSLLDFGALLSPSKVSDILDIYRKQVEAPANRTQKKT